MDLIITILLLIIIRLIEKILKIKIKIIKEIIQIKNYKSYLEIGCFSNELFDQINCERKVGKNVKIEFVKDRPGHDTRYALNSNKLIKQLKWRPQTNFETGLKQTFEWYLNNLNYFKSLNKKDILSRLGLKSNS